MSVSLDLPFPPSVNGLYAGKERRYKSPAYKTWQSKAVQCLTDAPMVDGPVSVVYTFTRPDKRKRDLGNLEKAVSDILVKMSVIEDDSFIADMRLKWGETDKGCRVEIERAA